MANNRRSRLQKRLGSGTRVKSCAASDAVSFITSPPAAASIGAIAWRSCALLCPRPRQRLKRGTQRFELRAEAGPVTGLETLERTIVIPERRMGAVALDRCGGNTGRRFGRTRPRRLAKKSRQRVRERLLHHDAIAIGRDHPFELRQLPGFGPQIER